MKRVITLLIFLPVLLAFVSCSSEGGDAVDDGSTCTVMFKCGIRGYDDVSSRATAVTMTNGAKIYITFKSSNDVVNYGTATYTDGSWNITPSTRFSNGSGDAVLYYFENPSSASETEVTCNSQTAVYSCTGSWTFSKNTLTVTGTLVPVFSRIRFRGTASTGFAVSNIVSPLNFTISTGTLTTMNMSSNNSILSSGFSRYDYATLESIKDMFVNVGGVDYVKNVVPSSDAIKSIVLDLPTASNHVGWHDKSIADSEEPEYEPVVVGPEAVDLGLSVKWATFNVGATKPEDYGGYYAWGETETKNDYSWSTYKWCNGSLTTMTKYCTDSSYGTVDNKTALELEDDVAHVKWGGSWRMPTQAEQDELRTKCTWTWTKRNGVKGYEVKSKTNGNSIFLPAAGCRYDASFDSVGSDGDYWSSSLYVSYSIGAYYFYFGSSLVGWGGYSRYYGQSVRAVCP